MPIPIQCEHCHKKYNAPDSMAGKKIKCRNCGKVVSIPKLDDEGPDVNLLAGLEGSTGADVDSDMLTGSSAQGSRIGAGIGSRRIGADPSKGIAHKRSRSGDASELAVAEDVDRGPPLRPSLPFDFPGAPVLDNLAPVVLIVLGLGWLALMAVNSNDTRVGWVGMMRLGLYSLLYVALAFPICYTSLKWASRQHRFMMPPTPRLRAFGAFAVPFAMAFAFWLSSQNVVMLILGMILGALIAGAAVWFLFRIQPYEMGAALGGATGAYAASVIGSYLILLGINLGFAALMRNADTNDLDRSPVAPGFAWDVPVKHPDDKPRKPKTTDRIMIAAPTTEQSPDSTTKPAVATTEKSPDNEAQKAPGTDNAATNANTQIAMNVNPGGNNAVTTTTKPSTTKPIETAPPAPASPFVAQVTPGNIGEYSQIVYPAMPSNFMAVVRSSADGTEDKVELWTLSPLEKKGEKKLRREKETFGGYALSPSGEVIARVSSWPKLAIQVHSFAKEQGSDVVKEFPFDSPTPIMRAGAGAGVGAVPALPAAGAHAMNNVKIRILGFGANDNLVVHWSTGMLDYNVEVLRTKGPAAGNPSIARFTIDKWEVSSGNPSINPKGTHLAVATFANNQGGIDIYDLAQSRGAIKSFIVDVQPWAKPAGMSWSPSGQNVAAFWDDGQGRCLLVDFKMVGDPKKPAHSYPYEVAPYPPLTYQNYGPGRTLDWLPDGNSWLMFGQYVIDVETGKNLGDLGLPQPKSQHILDKEQVIVQSAPPGAGVGASAAAGAGAGAEAAASPDFFVVKLKNDAIAAKRSAVKKGGGAAATVP
jgi:hypothetical protein